MPIERKLKNLAFFKKTEGNKNEEMERCNPGSNELLPLTHSKN
jgi:hypothetical protein